MKTQALLEVVRHHIDRQPAAHVYRTAIDSMLITRATEDRPQSHLLFRPALCIAVQGAKRTTFGTRDYLYRAGEALVVSVEMPAVGQIVQGTEAKPAIALVIGLDMAVMRGVLDSFEAPPPARDHAGPGVFVESLRPELAECAARAVRMLDTPHAIPVLYPGIMRELCYWLLAGPNGGEIVGMLLANGQAGRVVRAVHALRDRFDSAISIDELAQLARMSPSAFHRQFKALTSMTPLQYQKQLRLLEARRMIASDAVKVEEAAFKVGYESASQFSREYSRMFGTPPKRDAAVSMAARREGRGVEAGVV